MKRLLLTLLLLAAPITHASTLDDAIYAPMDLIPQGWDHRDKYAHALMGGFIYTNVRMAYGHKKAFGVVLIVAIGKEVYDAHHGRPLNVNDIAASMAVPIAATLSVQF